MAEQKEASKRTFFVGGNWKCNGTVQSVTELCDGLANIDTNGIQVLVSPVSIQLPLVMSKLANNGYIVASQNVSATGTGAYTAEIAAEQLSDMGIGTTLIGHSERRKYFNETNAVITEKVQHSLSAGLNCVCCLGETLDERKQNRVEKVCFAALRAIAEGVANTSSHGIGSNSWDNIVIAYEPVWAIGTGVACDKDTAQTTQASLRQWFRDNIGAAVASKIRIIYGGSVKPQNCAELIAQPDIDGFLVGGAALKADSFGQIIAAVQSENRLSGVPMADAYSKLVFIRHGQSEWNASNRFTGWVDVGLTELGRTEALEGAAEIKKAGFQFDIMYTSYLKRAILTGHMVLEECDQLYVATEKTWRLNERMYGGLQGLNKAETVQKHGKEQVLKWRRSFDIPPPEIEEKSQYNPANDAKYLRFCKASEIPKTECLKDVIARAEPFWKSEIAPMLRKGKTVLVAAHGNSIRAIVKYLDQIDDSVIPSLEIPTGIPLVYEFDKDLQIIPNVNAVQPLTGLFLGNPERIKKAQDKVKNQISQK